MMNNKVIAVDCRISQTSLYKLSTAGYKIIMIPENSLLDKQVSAHPDMHIAKVNNKVFVDSAVNDLFTFIGETVKLDREVPSDTKILKYPNDIGFNCACVGNNLICNIKYTHKSIINYAKDCSMNVINVNQGYAKCSVCVVSDNAIITEDESVAQSAAKNFIDVLKIEKGHVILSGYDYGFIGGCCGLIENDTLAFNGNLKSHPEYKKIISFCENHGVNTVSLSEEALYDVGTIYRII